MLSGFSGFQSNSLHFLVHQLHEFLFATGSDPFAHRIIIVPNQTLKNWLQLQLADIGGIVAALEIYTERAAISHILSLSSNQTKFFIPTRLNLSFVIEKLISETQDTQLLQLIDGTPSKRKKRVRLLADELAALFDSYSVYGGKVTKSWSAQEGWQQALWQELYKQYPDWITVSHACSSDLKFSSGRPIFIALFGLNFILPPLHRLLIDCSKKISINYFLPSPCQHFWTDLKTEREQSDLEQDFTEDRNSLAANYGKVGREGAKQIEEAGINLNSQYFVSRSVAEIPEFEERLIDDTAIIMNETSPSLLQAIQADILVLRKPTEPLALSANDTSIQLHSANSPSREIEAAYNTILGLIAKHNYCPADFLVMTPNIEDYHPFITAIFERQDSQLSYRIINSSLSQHHGYLSSFKNLITIVNGRWDSLSLLQLIEDPYIAKHFDFSDEDISLIRKWVETCHVTWGLDASHRNEYLLRHLCYQGMAEDAHIGTWSDGLKRLRQALVNGSHDLKIQFTEADLLSRLIYFLNSLQADLQSLADSSEMTLSDWTFYLECLSEGYLGNDESGQLKNILLQLKESSRWIPYDFLDFSSLSLRLDSLLDQQKASVQENLLNAVTFGNIRELSGQPAKVVIMIGMHEGAFPIAPREPKRDLLYGHKQADIKPTLTDLDRYYYLQTLMSAQDYLIFSYQNTCPRDGKQQEPALPITDLLSYIRCYYSEAKAVIINHPFYSFDPAYFVQNASFKAYSYNDFSAASILADNKKMPDKGIVPELFQVEMIPPEKPQDSILSTDDLLKAAKDPLNLFLQGQGLYYKDFSDKDDTTDEPFILSTLDHYLIKKNLLTATLEDVLKQAHESGIMPLGLFEKAARLKPIETASLYQNVLNDFQVRNLYVCEFVPHCLQPTEVASNYWQLPAPKIQLDDGSQVTIVGKLNGISNKGLVNISKQESRQLIRSWPALLLAPYLTAVGMPARVLFLESAIQSKELSCSTLQDLKEFVQYAKRCKNHPSPLLDEYVEDFIKIENSSMLQSKILDRVKQSYNVKAKWIFSTKQQFSPEALKQWQTNAKHLYSKVLALKESAR